VEALLQDSASSLETNSALHEEIAFAAFVGGESFAHCFRVACWAACSATRAHWMEGGQREDGWRSEHQQVSVTKQKQQKMPLQRQQGCPMLASTFFL
jgi:hypothetical protein